MNENFSENSLPADTPAPPSSYNESEVHEKLSELQQQNAQMKKMLFGTAAIVTVGGLVLAAYMFGANQNRSASALSQLEKRDQQIVAVSPSSSILPSSSPVGETSPLTPQTQETQSLKKFSSPHLQGFEFMYDPKIWTITTQPDGKNLQLTLQNPTSGEKLTFGYGIAFGMGGGIDTFEKGELVKVDGTTDVVRLETVDVSKKVFRYGRDVKVKDSHTQNSIIVFFKDNQEKYQEALDFCKELEAGVENYPIYSKEQCGQIKSGAILGYVYQPPFDWSLQFKSKVPMNQISTDWANDPYVKSEKLDNGIIFLTTTFEGTNVQEADKIVKQLKFSN